MGPWLGRPFILGVHEIDISNTECGGIYFLSTVAKSDINVA